MHCVGGMLCKSAGGAGTIGLALTLGLYKDISSLSAIDRDD